MKVSAGGDSAEQAQPRPDMIGVIKLGDAWPWLVLIGISISCIIAQAFGFFHEGMGLYMYLGACTVAMGFGFVGLYSYISGEMARTRQALKYSNLAAATEHFFAEMEAGKPEYKNHWKIASQIARVIGERMGMGEGEIEKLKESAGVMDIGMLESLNRLESLPAGDEFEDVIKLHPLYSERVLGDIYPDWAILPIVRHHHENYDGTGYPDGLEGFEIPLASRILAVADAFAGKIAYRPGEEPLTMKEAVEELEKDGGTLFDPDIVEVVSRFFEPMLE